MHLNSLRVVVALIFALDLAGCPSNPAVKYPTGSWELSPNLRGTDPVTPTMIRVSAYGNPVNALGMCATVAGEATSRVCADGDLTVDRALRADLNQSDFRYYSRTLDVEFQGGIDAGSAKVGSIVIVKKMQMVMEWARWRVQTLTSAVTAPFVSGADVGIGVRIIFDVTLTTTDSKAAANFGFGTLATSLATNSATILVRYDSVGTTVNLLPESSPTTITTVDAYVKAINAFYDAVRDLSIAYAEYSQDPENAKNKSTFTLGVLSFYIENLPRVGSTQGYAWTTGYTRAVSAIGQKITCSQLVASVGGPISDSAKKAAFIDGVLAAYSDLMAVNRCDSTPITEFAMTAAKKLTMTSNSPR